MPFPSPQGTQAAVNAMLACLARNGHDAHLLTYGYGRGQSPASFTHHRASGAAPTTSLRSGPSFAKLWMDANLSRDVRRLVTALKPDLVVAHHVEASMACHGIAVPTAYVAHTTLAAELSTYAPERFLSAAGRFGRALDGLALSRHDANAAIAPELAASLRHAHQRQVRYLPLPWPRALKWTETRDAARTHYGIAADAHTVAYLGNLDRYQGIPFLLDALELALERDTRLHAMVATASDSNELVGTLRDRPIRERLTFVALGDEQTRARVHAAADVIAVPRAVEGGVPIKLLDALARNKSVVTVRRAASGLPIDNVCVVCRDDSVDEFAHALVDAMNAAASRTHDTAAYLDREHSDRAFMSSFEALFTDAQARANARPSRSRLQAE